MTHINIQSKLIINNIIMNMRYQQCGTNHFTRTSTVNRQLAIHTKQLSEEKAENIDYLD